MRGTCEVREHCDLVMDQYLRYAREGVTAAYTHNPSRVNTSAEFNETITSAQLFRVQIEIIFNIAN